MRSMSVTVLMTANTSRRSPAAGCAPRENAAALLVEIDLERVHLQVAADHRTRHVFVAGFERRHRVGDLMFDDRAHREYAAAQVLQFLIELARKVLGEVVALRSHVVPRGGGVSRSVR